MNILGMIGGTSWYSTIDYYRLINELASKEIGSQANPPLILYSLNIELMRSGDRERINSNYLNIAQKLEKAGAKAIIICANTPHMVYPYLKPHLNIPILHIADAIGKEANRLNLKKLGLLGNKPTMTGGFIQSYLKDHFNIECIIPEKEFIEKSHYYVSKELTQGIFSDQAKSFFLHQMEILKQREAQGIILGCTELPLLINQDQFDLPLLATTHLHAEMAVNFILKGE